MQTSPANPRTARLAVAISGNGTLLQALMDACAAKILDAEIALVLSTNHHAYGLTRARNAGIATVVVPKNDFPDAVACARARHEALVAAKPDLIVLAGFLGMLGPQTVAAFPRRVINTHPALLPAFGGKGMFGRHVHEAVIASSAKQTGCTVHLVDEHYDHGEILAQAAIPVLAGDTPEILAARLSPVESALLVKTVGQILNLQISKSPNV